LKQVEAYQQDPKAFEQNADNIQKIAQLTGSDVKDIPLFFQEIFIWIVSSNKRLYQVSLPKIFSTPQLS
jgi:ABC-type taurine transport system substrate-binding protein